MLFYNTHLTCGAGDCCARNTHLTHMVQVTSGNVPVLVLKLRQLLSWLTLATDIKSFRIWTLKSLSRYLEIHSMYEFSSLMERYITRYKHCIVKNEQRACLRDMSRALCGMTMKDQNAAYMQGLWSQSEANPPSPLVLTVTLDREIGS